MLFFYYIYILLFIFYKIMTPDIATQTPMTFEQAMAILDRRYEETMAKLEIEKQLHAAEMKKREEEFKEYERKREEEMKILTKNFGIFGNRLGEIIEYMVAPNIAQMFDEFGFNFETILTNIELKNREKQSVAEVDILLLDGDKAMAVEVKTKPKLTDLERHLKRINRIQTNSISLLRDIKQIYVAIAGAVITPEFKEEAFNLGFYVISQQETNVEIFQPPIDFIANY